MIFPSNRVRIMVATKPIDFRKGHDSLAAMVKNALHKVGRGTVSWDSLLRYRSYRRR